MSQHTSQPGHVGQSAVVNQPVEWVRRPTVAGCPPGLEYLSQVDQLLIKQKVDFVEIVSGFEAMNKYRILNSMGQQVYFAAEESTFCHRQCCKMNREFKMHILDNMGAELLQMYRPFRCVGGCCGGGCCNCDTQEIFIEAPPGNPIGMVRQQFKCCVPLLNIYDANDNHVFKMTGPCCICPGCCCDVEFPIIAIGNASEVGKVTKQWTGLAKEMLTDADNFSVTFPMDLDVKMKANILGALFLLDFMFFEDKQKKHGGGG